MKPTLAFIIRSAACLCALDLASAQTSIVSLSSSGQASDHISLYPEMTPDARYVAFQSTASTLTAGDTNGVPDVFLHDRLTATTIRVSVHTNGQQGDDGGLEPAISDDGRFVAFFSYSTNLVAGDTNATTDIFLHDVQTATTTRVSVSSSGMQGNGGSRYAAISGDGRYVAFESKATNLVAGDTNDLRDVFLHDTLSAQTTRVSVDALGAQGDGESLDVSMSADARWIAFESTSTNLVLGDANGVQDVFVKDLQTGAVTRISVSSTGAEGDQDSGDPTFAGLGRYVAFGSDATNLVLGDTNGFDDVFVHDLTTSTTVRASVSTAGAEGDGESYDTALTPDGRYVVFYSETSTLAAGDTNFTEDIYLRDLVLGTTERVSVGSAGQQGNGYCNYPAISGDGRLVAFDSVSNNFVLGDVNGARDIFIRDRASPFAHFCPGDGSQGSCPCANDGLPHRGCDNSASTRGATLEAAGDPSVDNVRFFVSGMLPSVSVVVVQATGAVGAPVFFGDGLRCISGGFKRLYLKNAINGALIVPGSGDPSITARSAALGDPLSPGDVRYYQVYYRDPAAAFCTSGTFNLTNGVHVTW